MPCRDLIIAKFEEHVEVSLENLVHFDTECSTTAVWRPEKLTRDASKHRLEITQRDTSE